MSGDRKRVFVSYAHHDKLHFDRLCVHLRPLEVSGVIDFWNDTRLQPGSDWRREISDAIASAKVAILLVTADFLASEFITDNELPPLLAAAREEGALVLPVCVSACQFKTSPLSKFQAVNVPERPLAQLSVAQREHVWVKVADAVEAAFVGRPATEGWLVSNEKEVLRYLKRLILSAEGSLIASYGDFYVQFSVQKDHLYCEAVANTSLPEKLHLTEETEERLLRLGFQKPTKDVENYRREYARAQNATQLRDIAALTVQVFAEVYDVSQNADIELEPSWEEPGNA